MATEKAVLAESYVAAEDLSSDQYRFVVLASTGVRRPDSATEIPFGILQNAPAAGDPAVVMEVGRSKFQANAALGVGTFVMLEYVSAADAGKGADASGNLERARGLVVEASDAEDDLGSVLLLGLVPGITQVGLGAFTVTTDTTGGANTWSAAEMVGGLLLRDPAGADRSDVTATAALIVAAIAGAAVGSGFEFTIQNTADGDETLTLTAGAGVTLSGTMTIFRHQKRRFLAVVTNAGVGTEAVTIYNLGATIDPVWKNGNTAVALNVLTIPITHRHVSKTTDADAEALTLANGDPGQLLTITLVTDGGGDGTLTPTTKTGFATIVFADAGDSACLQYVDDTIGWVLVGTAGVAAPPVISV